MARPLKLNACYFSHDAGMRNHRKVKALRNKFGHVGYSVWCMLLETLTDADLFQTDCTELEIELMSADFMVTSQELTDVIDYCVKLGLLARSEEGKISCPSLNERLTSVLRRKSTDLQKKNPELLQQKLKKKEEVAELLQQKPDKNGVSDEFPLINKKKEKETFSMCIVNNTSSNADASEAAKEAQPSVSTNVASIQDYYNSQVSLCGAHLRQSKGLTKKRRQAIGARLKEYGVEKVKECVDKAVASHFLNYDMRGGPADLGWIMSPDHFVKVLEGKYDKQATFVSASASAHSVIDTKNVNSKWDERRWTT